jgi:thiosulfate/3-mercaptopyruvate sulfurtransferase
VTDLELEEVIHDMGLHYTDTVVIYGQKHNIGAARLANLLMYAGIEDVKLLNGNYHSWIDQGFSVGKYYPIFN